MQKSSEFGTKESECSDDVLVARRGAVVATAHHLLVRRAIEPLLSALNSAEVDVMIFKGFHLAEHVYAAPGRRDYADVDMLTQPHMVDQVVSTALELGWRLTRLTGAAHKFWSERGPDYNGHEAAQLHLDSAGLTIDLHRRVVANVVGRWPPGRIPHRLTRLAWAASQRAQVGKATVKVLAPVDDVMFGLILNRSWGDDSWRLKASDYADFEAITTKHGLTKEQVLTRARAIRVGRTVEIFLARCDPFRGVSEMRRPTWLEQRKWNAQIVRERGPGDLVRVVSSVVGVTRRCAQIVQAVPRVFAGHRYMRRPDAQTPAEEGLPLRITRTDQRDESKQPRPPTWHEWRAIQYGVVRLSNLVGAVSGMGAVDRYNLAAFSLFSWLKRRGLPAEMSKSNDATGSFTLQFEGETLPVLDEGSRLMRLRLNETVRD